ncbi:MAG: hypothetical protein AAF074_13500, partial [Pseudomonadota bacterium]
MTGATLWRALGALALALCLALGPMPLPVLGLSGGPASARAAGWAPEAVLDALWLPGGTLAEGRTGADQTFALPAPLEPGQAFTLFLVVDGAGLGERFERRASRRAVIAELNVAARPADSLRLRLSPDLALDRPFGERAVRALGGDGPAIVLVRVAASGRFEAFVNGRRQARGRFRPPKKAGPVDTLRLFGSFSRKAARREGGRVRAAGIALSALDERTRQRLEGWAYHALGPARGALALPRTHPFGDRAPGSAPPDAPPDTTVQLRTDRAMTPLDLRDLIRDADRVALAEGPLPEGLTLEDSVLSGHPRRAGDRILAVTAENGAGAARIALRLETRSAEEAPLDARALLDAAFAAGRDGRITIEPARLADPDLRRVAATGRPVEARVIGTFDAVAATPSLPADVELGFSSPVGHRTAKGRWIRPEPLEPHPVWG